MHADFPGPRHKRNLHRMKSIKNLFRNIYDNEDVYTLANYTGGKWTYQSEKIQKYVNNVRHGKSAAVIGNGLDRLNFDLKNLKNKKIQTYGCNALYRDFTPDFLISVNGEICREISKTDYCKKNIVYAHANEIIQYPESFHLIPQDPNWNAGSIAAYLACFDCHSKVYLIGFDGNDTAGYNNNVYADTYGYSSSNTDCNDAYWSRAMTHVFNTYPLVDFILVNSTGRGYMPAAWADVTNLRRATYRDLVLECDL